MSEPKSYGGGNKTHIGYPVQRCKHGIREVAFCPACDFDYLAQYEPLPAGEFTSFVVHVAGDDAITVLE